MNIKIPKLSLVVLIGPSGSGKSTFASRHFLPTEVLSSDYCRALVSDDQNDQRVTNEAFEVMHFIARKRLAAGKLTVIDATNVQPESRKPLVQLARDFHCLPAAIVFNMPQKLCQARTDARDDRNFPKHVIRQQRSQMRRHLRGLRWEGFRHIFVLESEEQVDAAQIERVPLWNDKTDEHGPFDIIGDVHGCYEELVDLLEKLAYEIVGAEEGNPLAGPVYGHPDGRKAVFLGDIVDRGPRILDCLKLVHGMVTNGHALCVPGNHDVKLMRKLKGKDVQITYGLAETLAELDKVPEDERATLGRHVKDFIYSLVSHYTLDGGRLVVAHAGARQEMQGRGSGKVRDFCLYGETTGETDEFGLPVRYNWAAEYRGPAMVVYGHTPTPEPEWLNRTVNIDTGCVFGGKLTALRYPENEFVSVAARQVYCESVRPIVDDAEDQTALTAQQRYDDLLDADDVLGKRYVSTALRSNVTIREENAIAALEVISRFAVDPKWLIYLPPTMSPCETSRDEGYLEYPKEAFAYFRSCGVPRVVCQEKHMGSRAIMVVCKDTRTATRRFGVVADELGTVYTRTGRRFFGDCDLEQTFLDRVRSALEKTGFWSEFETDWACFDCELMPWSAKAQELLKGQYAAVGAAATSALAECVSALESVSDDRDDERAPGSETRDSSLDMDVTAVLAKFRLRRDLTGRYIDAYRQYCWPVESIADLKLAPFHLLATEGRVHADKDHEWHMETLAKICAEDDELLLATSYKIADVTDGDSESSVTKWWEELTGSGGEGMVVKPFDFLARGKRGLVQPALKCRGREYLRIIYGPEYTTAENLKRLRSRGLSAKRSLAMREFALGIEALERFARREPLRRVHECVFGVLALESEPVDPR
ncbi:MAG: polynucleotide kinase-phosphatase, partial [Planctomycetota bacterium]